MYSVWVQHGNTETLFLGDIPSEDVADRLVVALTEEYKEANAWWEED